MDEKIYNKIKSIKGSEWTEEFASEVYSDVEKHKYFITNLGKCTQIDARELPDKVYKEYLHLLYYPVGNGRFNIDKSIEDINWIIKDLSLDIQEGMNNEGDKQTITTVC